MADSPRHTQFEQTAGDAGGGAEVEADDDGMKTTTDLLSKSRLTRRARRRLRRTPPVDAAELEAGAERNLAQGDEH